MNNDSPAATPGPNKSITESATWFCFNATVFIAASCVMVVEVLSTRLAARYLGSSLYSWTSAIGVVLAGISLGNERSK